MYIIPNEYDLIFAFETPSKKMTKLMRPLFIKACLYGVTMNTVLVDNGVVDNIMPSLSLNKTDKHHLKLVESHFIIYSIIGDKKDTKRVILIETIVFSRKSNFSFFIVYVNPSYNALLNRDCIHTNKCTPSSMHKKL